MRSQADLSQEDLIGFPYDVPWPVTTFQGNTSTMIQQNKANLYPNSYVSELINEGTVALKHLKTTEMNADLPTKPLFSEVHRKQTNAVLGCRCLNLGD